MITEREKVNKLTENEKWSVYIATKKSREILRSLWLPCFSILASVAKWWHWKRAKFVLWNPMKKRFWLLSMWINYMLSFIVKEGGWNWLETPPDSLQRVTTNIIWAWLSPWAWSPTLNLEAWQYDTSIPQLTFNFYLRFYIELQEVVGCESNITINQSF